MCTLLYVNAYTLSITLVVGNHGYISIFMQDRLYMKVSPTPYNTPVDPGVTDQVPAQDTVAVFSQLIDEHSGARTKHDNHRNMYTALKTMVLEALDST